MQAYFIPSLGTLKDNGNPYWRLLAQCLEELGVSVQMNGPDGLRLNWLWKARKQVQIIHIHYYQQHYAYEWDQARLRWVFRFARNLIAARLLGYKIIWTIHNSGPSYPLHPRWVENLADFLLAHLSTTIIVHCEYARQMVWLRWRRRKRIFTAVHPGFIGTYPKEIGKINARETLDLPSKAKIFLNLGQMRPNKGIDRLLTDFARLQGDAYRLLVAGSPGNDKTYHQKITKLAGEDERVFFHDKWIADEEIQIYFAAADIVVTSFEHILTSSSVLLALTFGRPVITPRAGCMAELVTPDIGWLYNPEDPDGLLEVLNSVNWDRLMEMGDKGRVVAAGQNWAAFAQTTKSVYSIS